MCSLPVELPPAGAHVALLPAGMVRPAGRSSVITTPVTAAVVDAVMVKEKVSPGFLALSKARALLMLKGLVTGLAPLLPARQPDRTQQCSDARNVAAASVRQAGTSVGAHCLDLHQPNTLHVQLRHWQLACINKKLCWHWPCTAVLCTHKEGSLRCTRQSWQRSRRHQSTAA